MEQHRSFTAASHEISRLSLVASGCLLKLKELAFYGSHTCHEPVELAQEKLFILACLLDDIGGRAVADAVERIRKPRIQKPHMLLQIDEFLMQLTLLEHNTISSGAAV
jgi:hypothetical protein